VKPRSLLAASVLCAALTSSLVAHAQPSSSATDAIARNHIENGGRYYQLGRFADAAREFRAAYELSRRAELLFNLARALEDSDQDREALDAYERFEAAGAPGIDRATLHARIDPLRARLARVAAPPTPVAPVAPVAAILPPRETPPPPSRSIALPVALLGAGGALVVTGLALGLTVSSTYADLQSRCTGGVCDPSLQSVADAASTRGVVGDVLGGVGLAAVVTGVVLLLVPQRSAATPGPRVGLACSGEGCFGRVAASF
jgi:hypothetical protein